jgi:hypothetical protein
MAPPNPYSSEEDGNMKTRSGHRSFGRRQFLTNGIAAIAGATALALFSREDPVRVVDASTAAPAPASNQGYRVTPHVRHYYEKARF